MRIPSVHFAAVAVGTIVLVACGGDIKKVTPPNNVSPNNNVFPNNVSPNIVANNVSPNIVTTNNATTNNPTNNSTNNPTNNSTTNPTNNSTNNPTNNATGNLPIHVQLAWDTDQSDLDIHVAHELAAADRNQPDLDMDGQPDPWLHPLYDCTWRNPRPDWGATGLLNDPSEDIDDTDGFGPENINIDDPENVTYRIGVRYYDDKFVAGPTIATVRVFVGGVLAGEYSTLISSPRDLWEVATVTGDGAVTEVLRDGEPKITLNYSPGTP